MRAKPSLTKKILITLALGLPIALMPAHRALSTVSSQSSQTITALGDGATINFTISFIFQNASDVHVYLQDESTTPFTRTEVSQGAGPTKFTLTGPSPGTTVRMGTAPTTTQRLIIQRQTPITQTVNYVETDAFPATDHEKAMDKQILVDQELQRAVNSRTGLSAVSTFGTPTLPDPSADTFLLYNHSATDFTLAPTAGTAINSGDILKYSGSTWSTFPLDSTLATMQSDINSHTPGSAFNTHLSDMAAHGATATNTAGRIVSRDGSGNFSAGTVSANLTGNVSGNLTGTVTGNASTATALASVPTSCTAGNMATTIDAGGNLACAKVSDSYVATGAAISRSKLASGTASHVVINDGSGVMSSEAQLAISRGGTGANTKSSAFDALSPSSTKGDVLVNNGTTNTKLSVGVDGSVLTADSTSGTGLKWAASPPVTTATDTIFSIQDNVDPTIQVKFDAAGSTGTTTTLIAPQTSNRSVTLPDATTTLVGKDTTDTFTNKTISGASNTFSSIPNSATTATNANTASAIVSRDGSGNFSAGTIAASLSGNASTATALATTPSGCGANQIATSIAASGNLGCVSLTGSYLPNPSASTIGGVQSAASVSHQWINSISTLGVPSLSQPAFSDVSGNLGTSQLPTAQTWPSSGTVQAITPSAHGVLISGSGATASVTSAGTSGQILTSNGAGADPTFQAAPSANDSKESVNLGFSATASTTLVVALKQSDGSTDPAAGSGAVNVAFRSATTTSGAYQLVSFTAANSITLAAADSIGCTAGSPCTLYAYLIQDTTSEVCLSFNQFDDRVVQSASALTGGADTDGTKLWCTSVHTSRPIRLIGRLTATWSNPNWGTLASPVSIVKGNDANVTSLSSGLMRIETAYLAAPSAGTCSVNSESSVWINSISSGATGVCTMTLTTGVFSSAPVCICSSQAAGERPCMINGATSTSTVATLTTSSGSSSNVPLYIMCMGPR